MIEPRAKLTGFIPKDPETAGCEIHVEGLPLTVPT